MEANFRVRWDKVRAGGSHRGVREVVAKLTSKPFVEPEQKAAGEPCAEWLYEESELGKFAEIRERLESGDFAYQQDIAFLYGRTKPTAKLWLNKGIDLGLWTNDQLNRWFAYGKKRRKEGKTEAPVKPVTDWEADNDLPSPEKADQEIAF
jgi:hypothetical protein